MDCGSGTHRSGAPRLCRPHRRDAVFVDLDDVAAGVFPAREPFEPLRSPEDDRVGVGAGLDLVALVDLPVEERIEPVPGDSRVDRSLPRVSVSQASAVDRRYRAAEATVELYARQDVTRSGDRLPARQLEITPPSMAAPVADRRSKHEQADRAVAPTRRRRTLHRSTDALRWPRDMNSETGRATT